MKLIIFLLFVCSSLSGQYKIPNTYMGNGNSIKSSLNYRGSGVEYRIPIDTGKIQASTFEQRYLSYETEPKALHKELEYQHFLDLKTTESYLVCEKLLDIYEKCKGKELNGEVLYNYLQERNFLLAWFGHIEDVEDTKTKVFKLSKEQFSEILNLK